MRKPGSAIRFCIVNTSRLVVGFSRKWTAAPGAFPAYGHGRGNSCNERGALLPRAVLEDALVIVSASMDHIAYRRRTFSCGLGRRVGSRGVAKWLIATRLVLGFSFSVRNKSPWYLEGRGEI
jgi:hypothetical protein